MLVGHKIGLTSEPMQALLGVDEPDFGYILDDMVLAAGASVAAERFCAPRVEPEVAFLLRSALRGPNVTVEDVGGRDRGRGGLAGNRRQPYP